MLTSLAPRQNTSMSAHSSDGSSHNQSFVVVHRYRDSELLGLGTESGEKRRRVGPPSDSVIPSHDQPASSLGLGDDHIRAKENPGNGLVDTLEEDAASLTHSARAHVYENGFRYHGYRPGLYPFPNDESEQERFFWLHQLSVETDDGNLFRAPVHERLERGGQVLELGTGIGIWCEEMADAYPLSSFVGIDLSPIQSVEVPPNVCFFVDDMEHENGWEFDGTKFDHIFLRHTLRTIRDRPELMRRAYQHLKPGGYFEIREGDYETGCDDGTAPEGSSYALQAWMDLMDESIKSRGWDLHAVRSAPAEMRAAGFQDVHEHKRKVPIGAWPADRHMRLCGSLTAKCLLSGLKGLSAKPLADLGWTPVQIEVLLSQVRAHIRSPTIHAYMRFRTVYGRKPLE